MQRIRPVLIHHGFVAVIISLLGVSELVAEDSTLISPTNKSVNLLADDLSGFYTWLQDTKYEDPREVFTIDGGILRISGDGWGGLTTKREYTNFNYPKPGIAVTAEDLITVCGDFLLEVYNGHPLVHNRGVPAEHVVSTDALWDIVLTLRLSQNANSVMVNGVIYTNAYYRHSTASATQHYLLKW